MKISHKCFILSLGCLVLKIKKNDNLNCGYAVDKLCAGCASFVNKHAGVTTFQLALTCLFLHKVNISHDALPIFMN